MGDLQLANASFDLSSCQQADVAWPWREKWFWEYFLQSTSVGFIYRPHLTCTWLHYQSVSSGYFAHSEAILIYQGLINFNLSLNFNLLYCQFQPPLCSGYWCSLLLLQLIFNSNLAIFCRYCATNGFYRQRHFISQQKFAPWLHERWKPHIIKIVIRGQESTACCFSACQEGRTFSREVVLSQQLLLSQKVDFLKCPRFFKLNY